MSTGIIENAIKDVIKEKGLQSKIGNKDIIVGIAESDKDENLVIVSLSRKVIDNDFAEAKEDLYHHYQWELHDVVDNVLFITEVIGNESYLPKWLYFTKEVIDECAKDGRLVNNAGGELVRALYNSYSDYILYRHRVTLSTTLNNVNQFILHKELKVCLTKKDIYVKIKDQELSVYGYYAKELTNLFVLLNVILQKHRNYYEFSEFQQYAMFANRGLCVIRPNGPLKIFPKNINDLIRVYVNIDGYPTPENWNVDLTVRYNGVETSVLQKDIEDKSYPLRRGSWEDLIVSSLQRHSYNAIRQAVVNKLKTGLANYINEEYDGKWEVDHGPEYFCINGTGTRTLSVEFDPTHTSPTSQYISYEVIYDGDVLFSNYIDLNGTEESRIERISVMLGGIMDRCDWLEENNISDMIRYVDKEPLHAAIYPYTVYTQDNVAKLVYRLNIVIHENNLYCKKEYYQTLIDQDLGTLSSLLNTISNVVMEYREKGMDTVFKKVITAI